MNYPTIGLISPLNKLFACLSLVFFFIISSSNAQSVIASHTDCTDHNHESAVSNEKAKEAAFDLIIPRFQESFAKAIVNKKSNDNVYPYRPATCFAPNTDPAVISNYYLSNTSGPEGTSGTSNNFNTASRWISTATDGGGLAQGDLTTLTWSYVPDGTTIGNGGCQLPDAGTLISDVISFFNTTYGSPVIPGDYTTAPWHTIFVDMFDSWSAETGLTFVYEPNDDGVTNCLTSNPGILGTRGDMRISGHLIDGNNNVLACNYYPTSSGDMIIDTGDNFFGNNPGVGTFNVLAHEIGHGLGLAHVCPVNSTKLMEPFINGAFMGPQEDDLLGINRHYGDSDEENNSPGGAVVLGSDPLPVTYTKTQRSIDDNGDTDHYSFTTSTASLLSVVLTPTGTTYLEGTQNNDGSCTDGTDFNAQEIADVMIEVLASDGVTLLADGSANGAGEVEMVTDLSISAGTYTIRVSQQGALIDNVQMYDLTVDVAIDDTPCDAPDTPMVNDIIVCEGESTLIDLSGGTMGVSELIAFEDFDGGGMGYTPSIDFNDGSSDHFSLTDGSDISNTTAPYSFAAAGNMFWAAEDTDDNGGNELDEQNITTNDVSIAGYTDVIVCIDIAAGNENELGSNAYDAADYLFFQYNTDIQPLYLDAINCKYFDNGDDFNEPLHHDINKDGNGSDGPQILTAAQTFCYNVPNANTVDVNASMMSLRVLVSMDSGNEEVAFDNLTISGTPLAAQYKFYDEDPISGTATLLAGPTDSYDPMTTPGTSPQSVWVTECGVDCDSEAAEVVVTVNALPVVEFTALADLCLNDGVQAGLGGGTPAGSDVITWVLNDVVLEDGATATGYFEYSGGATQPTDWSIVVSGGDTQNFPPVTYSPMNSNSSISISTTVYFEFNDLSGGAFPSPRVLRLSTGNSLTTTSGSMVPLDVSSTNNNTECYSCSPFRLFAEGSLSGGLITGVYSGSGVTDDGNGMTYSFDPVAAGVGTHTITYTYTDGNGCTASAMDDVQVFAIPEAMFNAPTDLCINVGVQAGLSGGTPTGGIYSGAGVTDDGNGMTYSFDPAAAGLGTHTITYAVGVSGCSDSAMDDVEVFDLPSVSLSTAMGYCESADIQSTAITGGSPAGGVYSGIGVTDLGDGISYNFDPTVNGAGTVTVTYTYIDGNGCSNSASSNLDIYDCAFDIVDPCACLDNATPYDCNNDVGGDDGQFSETITISDGSGAPLPSGQTWTVVSATGAFDAFNVPAMGSQSAGVPVAQDGSVTLLYMSGVYEIPFVHVDDLGYSLSIEGPFGMGSPANVTLEISNKCAYPDPVFDPEVPLVILMTDPVITLGAMDSNGGTDEGVTYTLDGNPEVEIDPSTLALGFHTVIMTYDGVADGNGGISPDGGATSASPGCTQIVEKVFEIVDCDSEPPVVTCADFVMDFSVCPEAVFPNTPSGDWFSVPAGGSFPTAVGGSFIITVDLNGCVTDNSQMNASDFTGFEWELVSSYEENRIPGCSVDIINEIGIRDGCGNESITTILTRSTLMLSSPPSPMMVCQDITVQIDDAGMVSITPSDIDGGSTANCGSAVTLTASQTDFTCANLGANTIVLTGEDACGNTAICEATVTVEDNIAPTAECQDITIQLDEMGMASLGAGTGGTIVTQVLGALENTDPQFDRPVGAGTTCTVGTGGADHYYDVFEFSIDIQDIYTFSMEEVPSADMYFLMYEGGFDPLAACDNHINGNDDGGAANEPQLTLELMLVPGDYTLVSTSFFSNETGAYTINISSQNAGNVILPGGAATSAIDGGSTDNCDDADLTFTTSITDFTCGDLGANTVILTVTDASGNTATCESTVTVEDNIAPTVTDCEGVAVGNYTTETYAFSYIDISTTGALIVSGDDAVSAPIVLGSPFPFYGLSTTSLVASTNGFLSANLGAGSDLSNDCPLSDGPNEQRIIPFHDDLDLNIGSDPTAGVFYEYFASSPIPSPSGGMMGVSVFQWRADHFPDAQMIDLDFEVLIFDNGEIVFQYLLIMDDNAPSASVGINDLDPSINTTITCADTPTMPSGLQSNTAVALLPFVPGGANEFPNDPGLCGANVTLENPNFMDNCEIVITNDLTGTEDLTGFIPVGTTIVTYTATDGSGNTAECSEPVTVVDAEGPTLNCPSGIIVNLEAGECREAVSFSISATDNCDDVDDIVIEQTGGMESGEFFEPGITTITFVATDLTGNTSECSFEVSVVAYSGSVLSALTCNDHLNISLDSECNVEFSADMFLEGGPYSCYEDYIVSIRPYGNEFQEYIPVGPQDFSNALGTHEYVVTAPDGNSCWGEFTVENYLPPVIENCECPEGGEIVTEFNGTLTMSDESNIELAFTPGACTTFDQGVGPLYYDTYTFAIIDASGTQPTCDIAFEFTSPTADMDSYIYLYEGEYNPSDICENLIALDDDGGTGVFSLLNTSQIPSNANYYTFVVTSTGFGGSPVTGDYNISIAPSDANCEIVMAPSEACTFTCVDIDYVMNSTILTPNPTAGSCGDFDMVFSDELIANDCGQSKIIRTWTASNDNGSSTCVQEFLFDPIEALDITAPISPVELPCGIGTSPAEIAEYFNDKIDTDGDGFPDTVINPTNASGPNCPAPDPDNFEKNEGIIFGYFNYPAVGCDGNVYANKVDNNVCNLYTTYTDQEIPACAPGCNGNLKVIRTWTVLDWCTPNATPYTFVQIIKAVDTEAPTMELANGFDVSVNPWNCLGDFSLPAPTLLHDLCTSDITYSVSGPAGTTLLAPNTASNPSSNWIVFGANKGRVVFTYTASDCCGNTTSEELIVNVYDTTPPVPVATQNIVVNLTTSGQPDSNGNAIGVAKVFWNSVDNGSYDGCSDVRIEIRREETSVACGYTGNSTYATNSDFPDAGSANPTRADYDPDNGEYVKFCCEDITDIDPVTGIEFGLVPVRMRVFDDGNMNGIFGDWVDADNDGVQDAGEYDNFNETWVTVRVEGKNIASIVCPPDVTLACDMDYTDPTMIGTATTLALCGSEAVEVTFNPQLDACGIGFVIATYTVVGSSNPVISCNQRIDIENPYPAFDANNITYPRNLPTSSTGQITCQDDITYAAPTWTAGACDFIGYTEDVDTFFFEVDPATGIASDACFKILRRFTVIDWCVFDATNGQGGLYYGSQTIKITDREAPVLQNCEPAMFDVDGNCQRTSTTLTNSAIDSGDCASDWLKWQVFVDTWGDGIVDYEYSSFLPTNDSNINNDTNGNGINDRYLAPTSSDEEVSVVIPELFESSMYNHLVTWKVTDGCGNVASCNTTFMVVDKKAPTPYCLSVHTALMADPDGDGPLAPMVELWAKDFDKGAFDNCTAQEDLLFTFGDSFPVLTLLNEPHYFKGEGQLATEAEYLAGNAQFWNPEELSSGMVFDCNDRPSVNLVITVTDEKGNSDSCLVFLGIIDNNDDCENAGSRASIEGDIATATGEFVEGTQVYLDALLPEYPRSTEVLDGAYAFTDNELFVDYDVTAANNDNPTNGVSTLDLVLIQRHIVGLSELDSPYKVIAADISNDEKVSALDVIELRKMILGIQDEFNLVESWRFVDAAQDFAEIASPWPVEYSVDLDNLNSNISSANMVAVKMGDVNDTYTSFTGISTDVRSANAISLTVMDEELVANTESRIEISSEEQVATQGLQMTIELNKVTPIDIESSLIGFSSANYSIVGNVITISWHTNTIQNIEDGQTLFTIIADVETNTSINEVISISDRKLRSEVYVGESLEINNLELIVRDERGSEVELAEKVLLQNEPNPFTNQTIISYFLNNTESSATIKVIDLMGKVIYSESVNAEKGWNTHTISESDLAASGVYYYQLEAGNYVERKSMILVK